MIHIWSWLIIFIISWLVFRELYKIFNPSFIHHSYSSRIGKGTHLAVKDLTNRLRKVSKNYTQPCLALKCDIKKFFQSVPHQKLLGIIKRKVKDEKFLWLIREIIESFISSVDKIPQRERVKRRFVWQERPAHRQCYFADIFQHLFEWIGLFYQISFKSKALFQVCRWFCHYW